MVGERGFEPPTPGPEPGASVENCFLLMFEVLAVYKFFYSPSNGRLKNGSNLMKSGERGRNRTYNLLIKSQLLCQLSYAPTGGICR